MQTLAFLIDTIETPSAGTESQLLTLLDGLDPARFRTQLFLLRESDYTRGADLGGTVLGVHKLLSPDLWHGCGRLMAAYERNPFDLLQSFFFDANIIGAYAAQRLRFRPFVASRRNIGHWQTARDRWALRLARRSTTHYLANSRAAAAQAVAAEGADPARISIIHNALDLDRFSQAQGDARTHWGLDAETIVIGTVANLRPVKNLHTLIEALAVLNRRHPVAGVFIGEGPLKADFAAHANRLGIGDRVRFPGRTRDVAPALAAFDIAVLSSTHESFSNALIEYMAAGKPIVASNVGGNAEALRHGETGLLYDVARPEDLIAALQTLLCNPALRTKLGRAAQEDARRRFGRASILKQYETYYAEVIRDPAAPVPFPCA